VATFAIAAGEIPSCGSSRGYGDLLPSLPYSPATSQSRLTTSVKMGDNGRQGHGARSALGQMWSLAIFRGPGGDRECHQIWIGVRQTAGSGAIQIWHGVC
jgi:hypothetical protein